MRALTRLQQLSLGNTQVTGAARFVRIRREPRHGKPANPDPEIDRRIKVSVIEFFDHIRADNPDLRCTVGYESRDIESAHTDQAGVGAVRGKGQRAALGIVEIGVRLHPGARHHRQRLVKDASLGDGEGQLSGIVVGADDGHD